MNRVGDGIDKSENLIKFIDSLNICEMWFYGKVV